MQTASLTVEADDRHPLGGYRWEPEAGVKVRGLVHVVHGMAEHAARYAPVAERLTAAAFVVYGHDHRGHGRTATREEDLGFFAHRDGWHRVFGDLCGLVDDERRQHPDLPVVLLGHSMGSFLVQQYMVEHGGKLKAVVLSGTDGKPDLLASAGRLVARAERLRLGERGKSKLMDEMSFGAFNKPFRPNRTRFDWLSRDAAEVDRYVADPRCGFIYTSLWVNLLDALPTLTTPANLARIPHDLPVYVIAGSEDPVGHQTRGVQRLLKAYQQAELLRVTHRFYEGARHEVFNDNRAEVLDHLVAWLDWQVG